MLKEKQPTSKKVDKNHRANAALRFVKSSYLTYTIFYLRYITVIIVHTAINNLYFFELPSFIYCHSMKFTVQSLNYP